MVHKERIIAGIEAVLTEYTQDALLLRMIFNPNDSPGIPTNQRFDVTPKHFREAQYFLTSDGKYIRSKGGELEREVSPRQMAEAIFPRYSYQPKPLTVTKAKAWMDRDLGEKVRKLKSEYGVV